jgi:hypothetical protein
MIITETLVSSRANTSIDWPGSGYTVSSNNLITVRENIDFTRTSSTSDDGLTKTSVTTWSNLEKCIEVKTSASNEDVMNWLTTSHVSGLTIVRTIENT